MDAMMIAGILFFIIGFILIGIEMVIPGFGAPGISGIICLAAGLFLAADTVEEGIAIILIVLALLAVMLVIIMSLLSKGKLKSPIILKEEQDKEKGYLSSQDLNYLLGKKGVAATDLRPSGRGNFEGIEFNIISDGKYICKGTEIEICQVNGSKLVVKEI